MNKILVVDDERGILISCKRILEKKGYMVSVAETVTDARKVLSLHKFDLAVIDCTLGLYTGKSFIEEIKVKYPIIGVMVISAYFYSKEIDECIKKGAYCCLDKPFETNELLGIVSEFFRTRKNYTKYSD